MTSPVDHLFLAERRWDGSPATLGQENVIDARGRP